MKKIKKILLLYILATGVVSCKKDASVKVTVYDGNADANVPGVKVALFERKQSSSGIGGGVNNDAVKMNEATTDVNGQVMFNDFETRNNSSYAYFVQITELNGQGFNFYPYATDALDKGKNNERKITIYSSAFLFVKFISPPPYGPGDSLAVRFDHEILNHQYPYWFKETNTNYSGGELEDQSGKYYITIDKYKSGVYTYLLDTIYLPPYSHTEYDVAW